MPKDIRTASSPGRYFNTGNGQNLVPIDIAHKRYMAVVDPDTAFWALVKKTKLAEILTSPKFMNSYREKALKFAAEMRMLRFGLTPSAVYFNPTERCNLNCSYCYIPGDMRRRGKDMSKADIFKALRKLRGYFGKVMPKGRLPQVIFHGAEPMLNRDAVFEAMTEFNDDFRFGVQTNGTLLDDEAIKFLTSNGIGVGLSLDAPTAAIANKTRKNWNGEGVYDKTLEAMRKLKGYEGFNVICTVTKKNVRQLPRLVEFFHKNEVTAVMLNALRCTLPGSRGLKPADRVAARYLIAALDRSHELYRQTGRKLVVVNFANILIGILAPTARRLMCDISPCGGGRAFFAVAPDGGMFPCSEFIGLPKFKGGNLFKDNIGKVLDTPAFREVTERKVEDIEPCNRCAIRHFCGSPCPAEVHEINGDMNHTGAFCEFYEEQTRYAFRLIADGKADDFLWDDWDKGAKTIFDVSML
ncbi:MAG: peptide-modifying radical SAM enzyme CbpB [Deltaproteobacteria bacterium]